ncbi:IPTL-CTERM sorting domain-containing protein [Sphingomonas sp. NCPPB 2930]
MGNCDLQAASYALSGDRRTETYSVTDNQAGDSNTAAGAIEDPFAPMVFVLAAGVTSVPTLSEWGLMLMGLLIGLTAWRMRRTA